MKKIIVVLFLVFVCSPSFSQSDTALVTTDTVVFDALFSDLYRTARGDIDASEIQESAIGGLFNHLNLLILAGLMILAFTNLNLLILSSGMSGKGLDRVYNTWSSLRVGVIILMLMPVLNGFSMAQYGVLYFVQWSNDVANKANKELVEFSFSNSRIDTPSPRIYPIRKSVEQIYHSEICRTISNSYYSRRATAYDNEEQNITERHDDNAYTTTVFEYAKELLSFQKKKLMSGEKTIQMTAIENEDVPLDIGFATIDGQSEFSMRWGSQGEVDSCGKVDLALNLDGFDSNDRERLFANNFWYAHVVAMKQVATEAEAEVIEAFAEFETIEKKYVDDDDPNAEYKKLAEITAASPLVAYLDMHTGASAIINSDSLSRLDAIYIRKTGDYVASVKEQLLEQAEMNAKAFDAYWIKVEAARAASTNGTLSDGDLEKIESEFHPIIQNAAKGWMFAGFRWWDLSRDQSFTRKLEQLAPSKTRMNEEKHDTGLREYISVLQRKIDNHGDLRTAEMQLKIDSEISHEYVESLAAEYNDDFSGFAQKISEKLSQSITSSVFNGVFTGDGENMLASLQSIGHNMMLTGETLVVASAAVNVAKKFLKKSPAFLAGPLAEFAANAMLWSGIVIVGAGAVLAFYIPMLPAIHWIYVLITYIEKVVETVIFSAFWLASMSVPSPNDSITGGNGKRGLTNLAVLFLYPLGMLIALYFVFIMFDVVGIFIAGLVDYYIESMNKGYTVGVVGMLVTICILTFFFLGLTHKILSMMGGFTSLMDTQMDTAVGGNASDKNPASPKMPHMPNIPKTINPNLKFPGG
jgi:conjugal transfer/type IV secretion protein DotA/TraY